MIRLDIDHLPSGATPKPVWLWWSGTDATPADADRLWQAYLRRFDIEHAFRSARTAPTRRIRAVRSGKMRTTSVRRRNSLFSRSCGLFDQICRQISRGNA